jgi:hypothetical protein
MKVYLIVILKLISYLTITFASNQWPNHDISTLRLLQIVHRHGDRTPVDFAPNDPFKNAIHWREGIGELTTKGKNRMYKLGQYIRKAYDSYLGQNYSPQEVYARSSITQRCVESVSYLLSGVYPPNLKEWQWNNESDVDLSHLLQSFSVETFRPKFEDLVLNQEKYCPIVDIEKEKIYNSERVKKFLEEHKDLYKNLSKVVGHEIDISTGRALHGTLEIEAMDFDYYWSHAWTKEEQKKIIDQLYHSHRMSYRIDWDSPIIKRLRAGGLVNELNKNFQKVLDNQNDKKLYVYSTHDTQVAALMHALNIFNDNMPPFGATLLFELHQNLNSVNNDYFVKLYYHNETLTGIPHKIPFTDCQNLIECPVLKFFESTKYLIYNDFDKECNDL